MEEFSDSQNFCLKLSQDSTISDTQDIPASNEKDIIVISDSSSSCSSPKCYPKFNSKLKKHVTASNEVCISDSSDSDCTNTDNEKRFQAWRMNKKLNLHYNQTKRIIANKNNVVLTSDETSSSSSEQRYVQRSDKTSNSYTSSTLKNTIKVASKTNTPIYNNKHMLSSCPASTSSSKTSSSKTTSSLDHLSQTPSSSNKNYSSIKIKLTRKDTQNIMQNIKSTQLVYNSPRQQKEYNKVIDESIDNMHPAISFKDNLKTSNRIIDETPADSESDVVPNSQVNAYPKNYGNELVNAQVVEKNIDAMRTTLSERKKKQISQWLMTNSLESMGESSFSIVPASNRDEISSGNSSLERLEMNYETPNNRGKIRIVPSTGTKSTDHSRGTTPRQTVLHEFTERSKDNMLELRTLKGKHINNDVCSTPTVNITENINVKDCADILHKLYGASWREKVDALLPNSEPRRKGVSAVNRAVQTERKKINKQNFYAIHSDDDDDNDDSDTSLKDLRQIYPVKKTIKKSSKQQDSFINDETSSGSGSESLYYTALTNIRKSTSTVNSQQSFPPAAKRVTTICDSDTESKDEENNDNQPTDVKGRKLLFSDDENDGSSTSEFDPGDAVPPKPIVREDPIRTSRKTAKTDTRNIPSIKQKHKKYSFLESLSESVPIANAHPDARRFRFDYKNNKESLCNCLFKLYNEQVFDKQLPEDVSIEWNVRMRGTAGFCYNKKSIKTLGGIVKSSRIVLATKVLDTPDRLRDTLIHEMCHAAAWLINNVSDGHGPFWTKWANKAMKTFPELPPIRRCHDYKIKTKFTYRCIGCGYSIGRHSKSLDVERKRCGHCYGKFELLLNKTTKSGIVQVQTPKREPGAFALYVKENYNSVKKERNLRHAEVMKILGQQFSAVKIAKKQSDPDTPG